MDEADALRRRLRDETAAREAAEREIADLQAEKRQLEHRVVNAHRTLAYGLGKALIEARSLKGIAALPRRLRRLRLKQKAKRRERVPDIFPAKISDRLALVDPALVKLAEEGGERAADWVRQQAAPDVAKGRALAEIALGSLGDNSAFAQAIAKEAAELSPREARLNMVFSKLVEDGGPLKPPTDADIALAADEFNLGNDGPVFGCIGLPGEDSAAHDFLAAIDSDGAESSLLAVFTRDLALEAEALSDLAAELRFLGEPLLIRWPALLGCFDALILFDPTAIGGEIDLMARQAAAQNVPCFRFFACSGSTAERFEELRSAEDVSRALKRSLDSKY